MISRECWGSAGATGEKCAAERIMRTRLLNSCCSLAENVVSCALNEAGCYGKKCHEIVFTEDYIIVQHIKELEDVQQFYNGVS